MTARAAYTGEAKAAYRPREFEVRYGIGHTKLYELIGSGQIVARKLGSATVIPHEEAERWVNSLPVVGDELARPVSNSSEPATASGPMRRVVDGTKLLRQRAGAAS